MKTRVFLFGQEFEAEIIKGVNSEQEPLPCVGWLKSDSLLFLENEQVGFRIDRKEKILSLAFYNQTNAWNPFFKVKYKDLDSKGNFMEVFGTLGKTSSLNDSFECWDPNLASRFLKTAINSQSQYGHFKGYLHEEISRFAYDICRNIDWSLFKNDSSVERILNSIVQTSMNEFARTLSKTGNFLIERPDLSALGFDAKKLGAYTLATGRLPVSYLELESCIQF